METRTISTVVTKSIDFVDEAIIKGWLETRGHGERDPNRVLRFLASDATPDRGGDIIDPTGWDVKDYQKNPVILWAHDAKSLPIGVSVHEKIGEDGLEMHVLFSEVTEEARNIEALYREGTLKGVSVGFKPMGMKKMSAEEKEAAGMGKFGIHFTKTSLLELSACSIPCNPNALKKDVESALTNSEFEKSILAKIAELILPTQKEITRLNVALDKVEKQIESMEQSRILKQEDQDEDLDYADLLTAFDEG